MLRLLRSSGEFRRLFLAHSVSRAGDAFNTVALVVLVFQLTGLGAGVAGAVMFEVLPLLLLGPVAGLAADRLPRRRLMVGADQFARRWRWCWLLHHLGAVAVSGCRRRADHQARQGTRCRTGLVNQSLGPGDGPRAVPGLEAQVWSRAPPGLSSPPWVL
jgi:hypothetical protein